MARWRLTQPHYLNVPGTEWEYKETDRSTGKQGRKIFAVHAFLNPDDAADHNYRELGEIIVSDGNNAERRDIIFVGEPGPDMEPIDEEAEKISDSLRHKWKHPIDSLDHGLSASLLSDLQKQLAAGVQPAQPIPNTGVSVGEFEMLKAQMAEVLKQNAALQERLEATIEPLPPPSAAPEPNGRRV